MTTFDIFTDDDLVEMRLTRMASADDVTRSDSDRIKAEKDADRIFTELVQRGVYTSRDSA